MQPMEDGTLAEDGCGFTFVAPADDGVAPNVFVPHDCRCPITGDVMQDPVVAEDGRSYEREHGTSLQNPASMQPRARALQSLASCSKRYVDTMTIVRIDASGAARASI